MMGKLAKATDAALWKAYLLDRSDANRNAILEFHWPWIVDWTARFLRGQRLDEVLSSVAERLLSQAIPHHNPRRSAFRTFIRRHIIGAIQDTRNTAPHDEQCAWPHHIADISRTPSEELFAHLTFGLPARTCYVMWMHAIRGHTATEIAKALDVTPGKVSILLKDGREYAKFRMKYPKLVLVRKKP